VSIITPTWQRHNLLMETIAEVRRQTYPSLEHVIVSDGQDRAARLSVQDQQQTASYEGFPEIVFAELGRNWSTFLPRSFGVAPLTVGALMAHGEYHMWLCDDERMQPDHVEHLVELIERTGADFVYPQVLMWKPSHPGVAWTIGADPPKHGQITNFLYRASALRKAMYRFDIPVEGDWDLVSRWMEAGASWAMSDRCTISHRADH
jgi:GT2 family glycosyltransferase